jgi:predicted dehydrogenase
MRLRDAVEASGVPMLVGHNRRHSAILAKAAEVIASGALGRIVAVSGTTLFYKAESEGYFDGANAWRRQEGGGPILINLIHEIDMLRALVGEIVAVQAFASSATRGFPVEDTAAIALRFGNGALGTFVVSDSAACDRSWEHTSGEDPRYVNAHSDDADSYLVAGTFGSLAIPTMRLRRYASEAGRSWHRAFDRSVIAVGPADPMLRQAAHFAAVVRGEAAPLVTVRDGVQNLRIVAAVAEAANTGRTIDTA